MNLSFVFYADSNITVEQSRMASMVRKRIRNTGSCLSVRLANAWFLKGMNEGDLVNYERSPIVELACFNALGTCLRA